MATHYSQVEIAVLDLGGSVLYSLVHDLTLNPIGTVNDHTILLSKLQLSHLFICLFDQMNQSRQDLKWLLSKNTLSLLDKN